MRVTLVVLLTHALIRPLEGVAAPTAPDMLSRSAPAMRTIPGFRSRLTEFALDDIDALSCVDPSQKSETMKESCAWHRRWERCIAATGQSAQGRPYHRLSGRPVPGPELVRCRRRQPSSDQVKRQPRRPRSSAFG